MDYETLYMYKENYWYWENDTVTISLSHIIPYSHRTTLFDVGTNNIHYHSGNSFYNIGTLAC